MSTLIVSETFGTTEKGVDLSSGMIRRQIGSNTWTRLRIGARLWIRNDLGVAPSPGSTFTFGLNSGSADVPTGVTASHFVGFRSVNRVTGAKDLTWSRLTLANTYVQYLPTGQVGIACKIVGATYTPLTTTNINTWFLGPIGSSAFRETLMFFEFGRTSATQMSCMLFATSSWASGGPYTDIIQQQFEQMMRAENPSQVVANTSQVQFVGVSTLQPVNEGVDGILDTVVCGWDQSSPSMVVNDIAVYRHA